MSKQKKGLLPRIEVLIVGVFFLSFILWAVSRCNATKLMYEQEWLEEGAGATADAPIDVSSNSADDAYALKALPQKKPDSLDLTTEGTVVTSSTPVVKKDTGTKLYVTIDGLNMRTTPTLESPIIMKLPLYEEVIFLNEVTDSTQQINMGKVVADEPWVKVKHAKGHSGWVYGAGVHYYKIKYDGIND